MGKPLQTVANTIAVPTQNGRFGGERPVSY